MRFLFNLFAFLSVLTFLGLAACYGMDMLSGFKNVSVSGTELTITASPIERILLGAWLVSMMFAVYFWSRMNSRK